MDVRFSLAPALVAVLVAGSALVFDPGGWQSFGPAKWMLITVASWSAAAATLTIGAELHPGSLRAWSAVLAWASITSVLAEDPLSAWIGTPDRRFGVLALAASAAAFVAGQAAADRQHRGLVARAAVVGLAGVAVYAALEALGLAPVELTTTTDRLGSTYGSAAYLGAALCLFIPIGAGLAADRGEPNMWRGIAALAVGGGLFALAGSGTRAAIVGLAAAAALSARAWWPTARRRPAFTGLALATVVAAAALSPLGERLVDPPTGRVDEWRVAISAVVSDPLWGSGLEGYRIVFPAHVDTDYVRSHGRTTVTDRAHSGPLDTGAAMGLVGVAVWVAAAIWLAARARRVSRSGQPVLIGMAAGLVALFCQELFLFPTLEVGVAAWAIAGVVVGADPELPRRHIRRRTVGTALAAAAVLALVAGAADVVADHRAAGARQSSDVTQADAATALRPDSYRYRLLAADIAFQQGNLAVAGDRIRAAVALSPRDPALRVAEARIAATAAAQGTVAIDQALAVVSAAVDADPNHPELRLLQGDLLAFAGGAPEAERAWLAAAHLSPRDPIPHLRLAELYSTLGRTRLAREALDAARRIQPDHPGVDEMERRLEES